MTNSEILFAAYCDEQLEEGFSYAMYLAEQLKAGLRILLLEKESLSQKIDSTMAAVTFAEANEHRTAKSFLEKKSIGKTTASLCAALPARCEAAHISASVHFGFSDIVKSVTDFMRNMKVDMVLLSPTVTKNEKAVRRLIKSAHRPVVTMAR